MHACKAAKRNTQRAIKANTIANANKTLIAFIAPKAIKTEQMYSVVSTRGAYAMQTGFTVNAKNITVYATFNCAEKAAEYIAVNKMGLYAAVIPQ